MPEHTEILRQGAAVWQLKSTLEDINDIVATVEDPATKEALARVSDQLVNLNV